MKTVHRSCTLCEATCGLAFDVGRLGEVGGAMFPTPAIDTGRVLEWLDGDGHGRFKSRLRGLPEVLGDIPAAVMAEEMETPGEGQIRALLTFAGNPVLSVPNGRRLDAAIAKLDFMVAIDLYVNETTRHADVILPHRWGHAASAPWQKVAGAHPGVSVNDWTDDGVVEPVVGQSILNGVPVRLTKVGASEAVAA